MTNHNPISQKDASDYLIDFAQKQDKNWLYKIIESLITNSDINSNKSQLFEEASYFLFHPNEDYKSTIFKQKSLPNNANQADVITANKPMDVALLQSLHSFQNFKKLQPELNLELKKGINIIFGMNGSGKSSLTRAIKILAEYEDPKKQAILHNVHSESLKTDPLTSFNYRLNDKDNLWSNLSPIDRDSIFFDGPESETISIDMAQAPLRDKIKFFDSEEMIKYIKKNIEIENFINPESYKLHYFKNLQDILTEFEKHITKTLQGEENKLTQDIEGFATQFRETHPNIPINKITYLSELKNILNQSDNIDDIMAFDFTQGDHQKIIEFKRQKQELEQLNTEEGRTLLTKQLQDIKNAYNYLVSFDRSFSTYSNYIKERGIAAARQTELENLQTTLNENNKIVFETVDSSLTEVRKDLLRTASKFGNFIEREDCPLCEQKLLTERSKNLFAAYQEFLNDKLQSKINEIDIILQGYGEHRNTAISAWRELIGYISQQELQEEVDLTQLVKSFQDWKKEPEQNIKIQAVEQQIETLKTSLTTKKNNLETSLNTHERKRKENKEKIADLMTCIIDLIERQYLYENRTSLEKLTENIETFRKKKEHADDQIQLSTINKNISALSTTANKELLEDTVKDIFHKEFKYLTGKNLDSAKPVIALKTSTTQSKTGMKPNVGGKHVKDIFSEGELKSYALSLFMAEAQSRPPAILVFDDPATSYDSNHMSLFCRRIADYYKNHKDTQIIIFTHHWEFFQLFQNILNKRNLQHGFQYIILENNFLASLKSSNEFTNWDKIKTQVADILNNHPVLSTEKKENISILLRRLIEHLVNEFVFANERSQYKPKKQSVSEFKKFCNIVPLNEDEATELGDLYFDLNPYAHADYRTLISTFDEERLKEMLEKITKVKEAITNRKGKLTVTGT